MATIIVIALLISSVLPVRYGAQQLIADGHHSFASIESTGSKYHILYANDSSGWFQSFDSGQNEIGNPTLVMGTPATSVSIRHFGNDNLICTWDSDTNSSSTQEDGFMTIVDNTGNIILANSTIETHHTDSQINSVSTPIPNVGYAILWQSYGQEEKKFTSPDALNWGIWMRVFDNIGTPLMQDSFNVNVEILRAQSKPAVDTLASGNVVVVWQGYTLLSNFDINIAMLSVQVSGSPAVASVTYHGVADSRNSYDGKVSNHTAGTPDDRNPEISCSDVGCLIVWGASDGVDGDGWGVVGRYFDEATKDFAGEQFIINKNTAGDQRTPHVSALADGSFAVTWSSTIGDGNGTCIMVTTFPSFNSTTPSFTEQVVNNKSSGNQSTPVVEPFGSKGGFVVMWFDVELDNFLYQAYTTEVTTDVPQTRIPSTATPTNEPVPETDSPVVVINTTTPLPPVANTNTPTDSPKETSVPETAVPPTYQPLFRTAIPYLEAAGLEAPEDSTTLAQDGIKIFSSLGTWVALAPFATSGTVLSVINILNTNPFCEQRDADEEIPFVLHPLGFKVADSPMAGAVIGNISLTLALVLLYSGFVFLFARMYTGDWKAAQARLYYPGVLVPQICFLLPSIIHYSALVLSDKRGTWTGVVGIIYTFVVVVLFAKIFRIDHKKCNYYSLYDQASVALPQTQSVGSYLMGSAAWESASHSKGYIDRFGLIIESNTHQFFIRGQYIFLNCGFLLIISVICSVQPSSDKSCIGHSIALFLVVLLQLLVILRCDAYSIAVVKHWCITCLVFMLAAITAGGVAGITHSNRFKDANESILLVLVCLCDAKLIYDVVIHFVRVKTRYTAHLLLSLKSSHFCYGSEIVSPIVQKGDPDYDQVQCSFETASTSNTSEESDDQLAYKPPCSNNFKKPPIHPLSVPRQLSTPAPPSRLLTNKIPSQPSLLSNTTTIFQMQADEDTIL